MGKKKAVRKTKELSVAIAESSSHDAEGQQQQPPMSPRKRGRPRKIVVEKTEGGEVKEQEETAHEKGHDVEGGDSKKVKTSEGKEQGQPSKMKEEATAAATTTTTTTSSSKKQLPTPRSRAKRKSKPRKSS